MAMDGPEQIGGSQSSRWSWQQVTEAVQRFGPAASVVGYGIASESVWIVLVGAVLELIQEPIRKVLMEVANEVGPAVGLTLKQRILRAALDNTDGCRRLTQSRQS